MADSGVRFAGEAAVLRRFVELSLSTPDKEPLAAVSAAAQAALAATFALFDMREGRDMLRFAEDPLNRILLHMTRRTEQQRVEQRSRVRGRVAWPETYKARYGEDHDPTRFVCFEVRHQFDTPENQLVKQLVTLIEHYQQAVPSVLRTGVCYFPASGRRAPIFMADRLAELETALSGFRRNLYMRAVTLPDQITELHVQRAGMAKLSDYQAAANLHIHLAAGVSAPAREPLQRYVTDMGQWLLLLPDRVSSDAEPWIGYAAAVLRAAMTKQPRSDRAGAKGEAPWETMII